MNGTGVGFSVERQYVSELPTIADEFFETDTTITVADSKLGWAKALKELIGMLYIGQIPRWDLSSKTAGAPLKTFGGRAKWTRTPRKSLELHSRMFSRMHWSQIIFYRSA